MGNILLDRIRISGFRGINDLELSLNQTTVLTGINNTGKTSILKALQLAIGNRAFLSLDDFYINGNKRTEKIIIDIRFVQLNEEGEIAERFDDIWEAVFKEEKIRINDDLTYVPLRSIIKYNLITNKFEQEQQVLNEWEVKEGKHWIDINGKRISFSFNEEIPFFYIDAKRDILEDIKLKSSYLGRLLSNLHYSEEDVASLEDLISKLNKDAVDKSGVLKVIEESLAELNSAIDKEGEVEITPFAKKIRDLNKSMSIHYGEDGNSFTMDFHGMGTRSWSSLLTLKAFINYSRQVSIKETFPFYPILAIEEPESHLHPNAQKRLYSQMNSICGQKIISTHSPYITASGKIEEIRVLNKKGNNINQGILCTENLAPEDTRKLNQKVIALRGEIFFSKLLVFFEGETEEQALPIFAEKHFGYPPCELGINFIGVGGAGAYLPFIRFAKAYNIPWFIFSDGEARPMKSLTKALSTLEDKKEINIKSFNNIVILDNEQDFERHLLEDGYQEEIEKTLVTIHEDPDFITKWINKRDGTPKGNEKTEETCVKCKQNIFKPLVRDYSKTEGYKDALYEIITSEKTQFGPSIAYAITDSGKNLPSKVIDLFDKINKELNP